MSWTTPIADRTLADIVARNSKAFFNVADWIRIHGNTEVVRALVNVMNALSIVGVTLTQPSITTIPSVADINAFIKNIDDLRAAACLPASLIVPLNHNYVAGADAVSPSYADVNAWENDLLLIRDLVVHASDYQVYCGVSNAGQARFWQNRFRIWPYYAYPAISPIITPRCSLAIAGASLIRQNSWRHYS